MHYAIYPLLYTIQYTVQTTQYTVHIIAVYKTAEPSLRKQER